VAFFAPRARSVDSAAMSCTTYYRRVVSGQDASAGASILRGALRLGSLLWTPVTALNEILRTGQGGARVAVPVISIGNLTVGGTGKTPLVRKLVADLLARGRRPVILSRGYAAEGAGPNDEARVLTRAHPEVLHLQDKDRASRAKYVSDARLGDVIVLDDGFQYHALARDLNVCTLDATNPFGYGAVLPGGLLREPLAGLYRARPVVITRSELVEPSEIEAIKRGVLEHNQYAKILVTEMAFTALLDATDPALPAVAETPSGLAGASVALASGIGNPEAFRKGVARLGARVRVHVVKGDHHPWSQSDVDALAARARRENAAAVITTLKDAVKLAHCAWPADAPPLRALDVEVRIVEGKEVWEALLDEVLDPR